MNLLYRLPLMGKMYVQYKKEINIRNGGATFDTY